MKKIIPIILVFLLSLSIVSAFPIIGSHDGLTFGADFGGWWIPEGGSMNLLLNNYNDWFTLYVDSVDANGCMVGIAPGQGQDAAAMANLEYVSLNDIVDDSGTEFGVYQVDIVGTIRCRVSYNFDFLGPISTTGPVLTTCAELDGGFAPYTFGSLTHNIATVPQPADDYCVDLDTLYEYYCASTDLFWVSDSSGIPNGDSCTLLGDTLSESWDTYTCEQIGTLNNGAEFECPYGCNVAEGRCNIMSEAPVEEGDEEEPTNTYTFCIGKVEGTHCTTDSSIEATVPCDGNGNLGGATEICQNPEVCVEDVGQGNAECAEAEPEDEGDTVVDPGESSCTETDFGNDPHQYGVTTHILGNTGSELHPDYCFDATTLREYYCEGERTEDDTVLMYYTYEDYECPGGCVDGECVTTCSETDGGFASHAGGEMTHTFADLPSPISDYCYSGNDKLMEYYCSDAIYPDENPQNDHRSSLLCDYGCVTEDGKGRCRYFSEVFNPGNIVVEIADWFGGFFNQDDTPQPSFEINTQPLTNGYEWIVDASTEGALAWPVIRGWDQGTFETNLECPAGYVVYSMEVEAEPWAGKPHVYGVLLHCAHAGGDDLLDLTDVTTVGWQNTPTGSTPFGAYNDDVITGMRGYYTTSGIEHMKVFDARQTQYIYNDNVPYTVGGTQSWVDVEDSLLITTSANSVAYCGGSDAMSQRDSVSALSGLRIYTTTRNSMDVVSGLQLRCTTIDRIPDFGF